MNRRVLICDDQPFLRTALARTIKNLWPNAEIVEAENGLLGEQILKEQVFDVIFMDLEMPVQNGLDTIKNIRQQNLAGETPVVVCTGCMGETEAAEGWESQFDYSIAKPFDTDRIDVILDEIKWKGFS